MRMYVIAACCAALLGSVSAAPAQGMGPQGQQTMKANDPMNANARMKKRKMKKGMMKQDGMSNGGMNNGMSGGGMNNGMSNGGMNNGMKKGM